MQKIPKRRAWKVVVNPVPIYMKLGGRPVVLQRFRGGKWERLPECAPCPQGELRLRRRDEPRGSFNVPTRGLRLRVSVPTKTVAPCYAGVATKPWRT